jgi:hypothetical protein
MHYSEIIYTPLDLPPCPEIDVKKLREWIDRVYPQKQLLIMSEELHGHKRDAKTDWAQNFPWMLCFPKFYTWQENFENEFPEIVSYLETAFGFKDDELVAFGLLPVKHEDRDEFWHTDPDHLGLRFYIYNEKFQDNKLYFRPTLKITDPAKIHKLQFNSETTNLFEKTPINAAIIGPRQPFYVNNFRAMHAMSNTIPAERIAVLIITKYDVAKFHKETPDKEFENRYNDLIVRSAYKYHKEAIFWNDGRRDINISS